MKKWALVGLIGVVGLVFMGCSVTAPVVPPTGAIYTSIKAPLDVDFNKTELGSKVGQASSAEILGFAFGDASTQRAALNGQIKVINHADYEFKYWLLGIYARYTTIVYGD